MIRDKQGQAPVARRQRNARRRVPARAGVSLGVLAVAAALGTWLARVPIASGFIDRALADKGVPARYEVADLGFGRQRLTNVVLGDPRDPDLVADWVETITDIRLSGAVVTGVRAGRVRLRARVANGRVSLGAIDRLLPPPSGKPFALPALDVSVEDARIRMETTQGLVGLRVAGRGRLNDGFRGTLAAVAPSLAGAGCTLAGMDAIVAIRIDAARPVLSGPLRAREAVCGTMRMAAPRADVAATLGAALDRWDGRATVRAGQVTNGTTRIADAAGAVTFRGTAARTQGSVDLRTGRAAAAGATAARIGATGRYAFDGTARFVGQAQLRGARLPGGMLRAMAATRTTGRGTPIAPLSDAAARAAVRAGERFDADATIAFGDGDLAVSNATAIAASGARLRFGEGRGLRVARDGVTIDGALRVVGGGLPSIDARVAQARAGGPVTGTATLSPFAAGTARLALDRVRFSAVPGGATRITTLVTLSGPLGDGRVDGLRVPVEAAWNGRSRLAVNPGCTRVAFESVAVSGLVLDPAALALCATGPALVELDGTRIAGGARLAATRLTGRLGQTPLTLAATGAQLGLGTRGVTLANVVARIGRPGRITALDFAQIAGRFQDGAVVGQFTGGGGQIGAVPLILSAAAGDWRLAGGALRLAAAMTVTDAETASPRFRPMAMRDVALSLVGGTIDARGVLTEPVTSRKVADVTLVHRLPTGVGEARLAVPGVTFDDTLQPDALTPLTFGVIADVKGTLKGDGRVNWSPEGVASTGVFGTGAMDLAAAFGPVTGIAGQIRFDDLLSLRSAPGQAVTVATINPGIPVTDGRITFQTLPGARVDIARGVWPFAGGTLTLEPTLLDFTAAQTRRMTFKVSGMDAGQFLQQFDFQNLNATGVFDGELPMLFDQTGGRIENGRLTVREGGGGLAYVGELTRKDLGVWANLAFQALRSLRYRNLGIVMNGPLAGEMVTEVRFAGVSQGEGAKSNFLVRRLQRLPFVFNIRIKAPFRGLLDATQSFYDPKRLIQRNLPALLEQQRVRQMPVQPPASETKP